MQYFHVTYIRYVLLLTIQYKWVAFEGKLMVERMGNTGVSLNTVIITVNVSDYEIGGNGPMNNIETGRQCDWFGKPH